MSEGRVSPNFFAGTRVHRMSLKQLKCFLGLWPVSGAYCVSKGHGSGPCPPRPPGAAMR